MNSREQVAYSINEALQRFPLVISILQAIQEAQYPFPGDDDLRCGAIRAVHTMAERLGRIAPAPAVSSGQTSTAEEIATEWLLGDRPRKLIPPSLLSQLAETISRLLPMPADSMGMRRNSQAS